LWSLAVSALRTICLRDGLGFIRDVLTKMYGNCKCVKSCRLCSGDILAARDGTSILVRHCLVMDHLSRQQWFPGMLSAIQDYSDLWRDNRKLFQQVFRPDAVVCLRPAVQQHIEGFLKSILSSPENFMSHIDVCVYS
jgi:hypothetical protein